MGMSWKDAKAEQTAKHATRALEEGRQILVFSLNLPAGMPEGAPISGVAEQIEAIEAVGWRFYQMFSGEKRTMVAVFRPRGV
jgi:hypothetical protein